MRCFVDTNVLVYAKDRSTAPSKQARAIQWLVALESAGAAVLSAQNLREYYWAMLRKDRSPPAVANLRAEIGAMHGLVPEALHADFLQDSWRLQDRHGLNFWDALLIASALAADCTIFLSEDMSAGQKVETLTIVNPFMTAPDALFGAA